MYSNPRWLYIANYNFITDPCETLHVNVHTGFISLFVGLRLGELCISASIHDSVNSSA